MPRASMLGEAVVTRKSEWRSGDLGSSPSSAAGSLCELRQSHPLAGPLSSYLYIYSEGCWEDEMKQGCGKIWCSLKLSTKVRAILAIVSVSRVLRTYFGGPLGRGLRYLSRS